MIYTEAQQEAIDLTERVISLLYEKLAYAHTVAMRKDIRYEIRATTLLQDAIKSGEPRSIDMKAMVEKYGEES